jgi:4-amino-4-deoxy-L-arabinose transferase-like glycosyltransferase
LPGNDVIVSKIVAHRHILPCVPLNTQPSLPTDDVAAATSPSFAKPFPRLCAPWILALIIVLTNAIKPVVIDDTAYLSYARQIAAHPFDPYGFTFFWYTVPENAFEVLCPPVVPYWLAFGIRLLGENPTLLKLWMYPFLLLFVWAVRDLLRRFARGSENRFLPLIALSPAILPTVNLMLDVPALALVLTAMALFIRATKQSSWCLAIVAGLVAGLAMQTKYTALLIPPAIGWYGVTRWRWSQLRLAVLTVSIAIAAFAGWELLLVSKYGRSHFAFHVADRQIAVEPGGNPIAAFIQDKSTLVPSLTADLGCLGIGIGLMAAAALGVPRRFMGIAACIWCVGFGWIALTPARWSSIATQGPLSDTSVVAAFWESFGSLILIGWAGCSLLLTTRIRKGMHFRANPDTMFLVGWLLIELGGYFALTPFGAARRVIGLVVIGGLLTARAMNQVGRIHTDHRPDRWIIGFGVAAGVLVTAIDTLDAFPEKVCAERATELTANRPADSTVWFAGHWGFQYYCGRAGMRQIVPGESILAPEDLLVLPIYPDEVGFYRPHIGSVSIHPPSWAVSEIQELIWDDPISAQTVPNFYCGVEPVVGRDHPRLRVVVYRITDVWKVPRK